MTRQASMQDSSKGGTSRHGHPHQHRGFGSRVQNALGRLAPKSWGVGHPPAHAAGPSNNHANNRSASNSSSPKRRSQGDLELGARPSTSSVGADAGGPSPLPGEADASRPHSACVSHISSAGSLAATATNDANSVASSSSLPARPPAQHAGGLGGLSTPPPDDMCSVATQAGSTAHSFTSLASLVATAQGDAASSDGCGSLIPAGPAPPPAAASTSPTAAGSSTLSLLSATYRSSDAGGDAASVSTLPLISETGLDEGSRGFEDSLLLEVQTLAEEQEEQEGGRSGGAPGSSEGGGAGQDPSCSDAAQPRARISSSHGSHTSLTSATSEPSGSGGLGSAPRMPSPAQGRMGHGQRSSSRHSFQQQLQQQLLQDLEESQEEGDGLPTPFSTRRRPDNDDMCSYATQAGSSVHSLSSVISHMEGGSSSTQQQQRPHWSSDGAALPPAGSSRSFSSLQQASASRGSRRSSAEAAAAGQHTPAAASPGPGATAGTSGAGSPVPGFDSGHSSPVGGGRGESPLGQFEGDGVCQPGGLQRKGSLKGALKAVSRWGSGISQRLQRTSSGGPQQPPQHQQQHEKQGGATAGRSSGGHELATLTPATQ